MNPAAQTQQQLTNEVVDLRARLAQTSEILHAIRIGEVDAVLVQGPHGDRLFTLKGADAPYRVLIEEMNQGAVTLSDDGSILYCNRRFADLLKTPLEEIVGLAFDAFVAPSERAGFAALLETGRTGASSGEIILCASDASAVPLQLALGPLPAESAAAICLVATDISERKRVEDALRASEERYREQARLLDLAQDAIMVRDMEDRIEFWNHGAEQLYGWTAAEVQGKKASGFLYKDKPAATAAARAAVIKDGKWTGECKHTCQDGGTVMVRSRWTLVRDELAAPKSILIINTDVTEQKKLETHLLRAQRLESIGTLASGVAHDLNNILTPILVCAQSLQNGAFEGDVKSLAALMEISARRGANVVKQVLTFARGVDGERVLIKPSHLIEEMIDIARKTFPKSIEIKSRYPEDIWSIEGDPTQLHQVLLNLSVNARDVMPQGGSLIIGAENFEVDEHYASIAPGAKAGPHVLLRVSDTGSGMSREVIDKIFDPFFTTKEIGKGTGLGLSTVFGIVKDHGGFISVYSEIDRGTTFKIFLPAQLKELPDKSGMTPELLEGHGELVLLVDDEANILRVTKMALENKNYQVVSASDGREALKIFSEQSDSIKVVLTDMDLPHLGGVALAREIRKMKPDMALIASTGQGEYANIAELQPLGVVNFLTKPYDTEKLLMTLRSAMETQSAVSEQSSPRATRP
jgi:two-component system cell cycle sensor histidine kinase/response regulator CckA